MKKEYLKKFTKDELIEAILFHIKNEFRIDSINYFERFLINLNHKKEMLKIEEDSNKLTKAIDDLKEFDKKLKEKYGEREIKFNELTQKEISEYIKLNEELNKQTKRLK